MEDDEEDIYASNEGGNDNATGLNPAQVKQGSRSAPQADGDEGEDEGEEEDSDSVCKARRNHFCTRADLRTPGYRYHHRAPGCWKA